MPRPSSQIESASSSMSHSFPFMSPSVSSCDGLYSNWQLSHASPTPSASASPCSGLNTAQLSVKKGTPSESASLYGSAVRNGSKLTSPIMLAFICVEFMVPHQLLTINMDALNTDKRQ